LADLRWAEKTFVGKPEFGGGDTSGVETMRLTDAVAMVQNGEIHNARTICGIHLASRLFAGRG